MKDCILFLSAYNPTSYKTTNWLPRKISHIFPLNKKKGKLQSLLKKHHLSFIASDEHIVSAVKKMNISTHYDYVHQKTTFSFESKDISDNEGNVSRIENSGFYINLRHAQSVLVDDRYFKINFTFWLEPFLVWIDDNMYQVDSGAFLMNDVLFVFFEIINYKTGEPLSKDDVCGKIGNYNLLPFDKYQFFDEEQPKLMNIKISELIYEKICDFLLELTDEHLWAKEYSFVYDTLVFSNNIDNVSDYFCKLIGVKAPVSVIKDISTVETYEYYPQEGCSVISNYDYDNFCTTLYPGIILEAVKLYIYIFQISNLEDETDIHRIIRNDIYLQNLFCSPNLPIETLNLLNYIKESEPYKRHTEALRLKISFLTAQNDLKRNRNSTILNILLYIISLLGAIGSLDVIEKNFGIPFKYSFVVVFILFALGGIWGIVDYKHNRNL